MAKHDVYPNPNGSGYLLNVQADLLDGMNTRIVVPLLPMKDAPTPAKDLNPIFNIENNQVVMVTQFLAAVPVSILSNSSANLSEQYTEITRALDMAFQGY